MPRAARLLISYTFLDWKALTPVDLGAGSWDEVDPCWHLAMLVIRAAIESERGMGGG